MYIVKCSFQQKIILFPVYILAVGHTPYGKRRISQTEPVHGKLNILH